MSTNLSFLLNLEAACHFTEYALRYETVKVNKIDDFLILEKRAFTKFKHKNNTTTKQDPKFWSIHHGSPYNQKYSHNFKF